MSYLRLAVLLTLVTGSACTTVDGEAVKKVKRVAIVGFSGKISEEGTSDVSARLQSFKDQQFGPKLYKLASAQLSKTFKWQFPALEKVIAAPSYQAITQSKSMQAYQSVNRFEMVIVINDLLPGALASGMASDAKTRAKFMKDMNVDALLGVTFDVHAKAVAASGFHGLLKAANNTDVMLYKCRLSVRMYSGPKDDPIWEKLGFSGETADSPGIQFFGISFPEKRQAAVVSSFVNATKAATAELKDEM